MGAEKAETQRQFANWEGTILPWEIISHLSCSLVLTNLTYFAHWNDSFSFVFVCKYCNFHLSFKLCFDIIYIKCHKIFKKEN